jgi:hypothetical protein
MPVKSVTDEDEREYLYERASQYGDENIKIVRIQKSSDPLVSGCIFPWNNYRKILLLLQLALNFSVYCDHNQVSYLSALLYRLAYGEQFFFTSYVLLIILSILNRESASTIELRNVV